TYTISFPVPADATNDDMWCRFRLAYDDEIFYYQFCGYKSFGEVEDYKITHPLSVGLSTFYASAGDGQATLYWSTQSETNNLGFYLMRSDGGDWARVNENLIPGHGTSETRHEYRYVDKGLANGVTYSYKVVDVDLAGTQSAHGPITVTPMASAGVPTDYALSQNYPNPFNANTTISYAIPQDSHVSVKIYNIVGEEVRTLVDSHQSASTYQVTWDSKDATGKSVSSGVYFCTLSAGEFSATTKMVYMR
ncbi:T9SS type A sorting domain-containing protein, partial [Candidatus Zixiibacteriota bacterium]